MRYFPLLVALAPLALTACGPEIFVKATATPTDSTVPVLESPATRIATPTREPTATPLPTQTLAPTPVPSLTPTPTQTVTLHATPANSSTPTASPTPTITAAPEPTMSPTPIPERHPSYPRDCIPPPPPDLDCDDIAEKNFDVRPPDPHRLDGDKDGIGCVE